MTVRLIALSAFVLGAGGFGIASTVNQWAIIDAVNAKLPSDDQFGYLGWYQAKILRLHREYRRLHPDGRLLKRAGVYAMLMWFCLVVAMGLIGFGFLPIALFAIGGGLLLWFTYFRDPSTL
ncbi:MAG: hypothetical protein JWM21_4498 [Acidobacteria bacterium]|nr:hypothetical protein [Acidobacteriota bacterium]